MKQPKTSHIVFLRLLILAMLLVMACPPRAQAQYYNGSQMTFGQNRVQHIEMLWTFYRFQEFDIYFYKGGKNLAIYAAKAADKYIEELEKKLDYQLEKKLQLVVFNKLSDLRQTNIGLMGSEQYNTGGVTRIVGTKILLYFDGDHAHFEEEIKAGLAQVLVNQMMYGGDLKDMLKNSTFLNLPEWYLNGLMSYLAKGWNMHIDNRVKDGIISGRYRKFNKLSGEDAVYAGHSIWAYIADIYGESVIPNILYMAKISRNIESGFLFVLGTSLKNLTFEWINYYTERYTNADKTRHLAENSVEIGKLKKNRTYFHLKISPDGSKAVYVSNHMGKYKVWLHDFETGKTEKIFKKGFKLAEYRLDYSFPLLDWHPGGKMLAMMREHKGRILLGYYDLSQKRPKWQETPFLHFEKIVDFSYSGDGKNLALSAIREGQSDIFVYNISSFTNKQITNDIYDDLHPRFVRNDEGILFSSNRVDDTLRTKTDVHLVPANKDIFYYDAGAQSNILKRITRTPEVDEDFPFAYDSVYFSYLSNANGINNRFLARLDSVISHIDTVAHYRPVVQTQPLTNYSRNIVEQHIVPSAKKAGELMFAEGRFRIFVGENKAPKQVAQLKLTDSGYQAHKDMPDSSDGRMHNPMDGETPIAEEHVVQPVEVNISNYDFMNDRGKKDKKEEKSEEPEQVTAAADSTDADGKEFKLPIQRNYERTFYVNQLVSQLDNNFLNSNYQTFTGGGAIYMSDLNALFKFGISDVMEDYKITGGFRLSGDFSSNEYMLSFENLKGRLDKQLIFHRQSFLLGSDISRVRSHMHELSYRLNWPFNEVLSARFNFVYRNDRNAFQAVDFRSLQVGNINTNRAGIRSELVFDNTRSKGLNLLLGSRWKIWGEYYNNLDIMGSLRGDVIARLNPTDQRIFVVGADFRHYMKLHREIIWANHFGASTSMGTQKLIYYLGGVDNWLFPKFDNDIPIDYSQPYVFQTLATNMRGFIQGVRNGVSFTALNSEVRIPVFRYFFTRPIKSDFLYNFQVVAFGDIGTAWTGKTPYSNDNSLNTKTIYQKPVTVSLFRQIEPIVAGYGAGLRARVWGYFLRTDWAWGIEDGEISKPVFYLSLSLDF